MERQADIDAEARADAAALGVPSLRKGKAAIQTDTDEIVVLRVDYFTNYAGQFLSVEAKTRLATVNPANGNYTGPTLSLSWNTGAGTPISATPVTMNVNIDPDTTPDTYIEHREFVRIARRRRRRRR